MIATLVALVATTAAGVPAQATVARQAAGTETIVDIRFHGNYSIVDEDLLEATGIDIGDPLSAATLELIKERLENYAGVGSVEIRKRYRSMTNTDDVVLLILIEEHVGVTEKFMFLPVFTWTDEYGVTYGGRFTWIDVLGINEHFSIPLAWGGEKQARAGLTFDLDKPAITRIDGGFGILRRENPHYEIDDTRVGGWIEGLKRWGVFELDANLRADNVTFGDIEESQIEYGIGAKVDTRQDAILPRNAVYLGAAWDRLQLLDTDQHFNRYTVDVRGYKTLIGHTILASQAYYRGADGRLPDWERPFLGGAQTLRGYNAGKFVGDNIALVSAEWRVPLTAPAPVGLVGLNFFIDAGAVYDYGTSLRDSTVYTGAGAGMYFFIAFVGLQVDAAYGFQSDSVRVHFSTGFRY